MAQIEFVNVTKSFKVSKKAHSSSANIDNGYLVAVDNVSLSIEEKDIFGIIGHSGAGKSTLVRLINQLESLSSGSLNVLGQNVGDLNEKELRNLRKDIGMIFQQFNLFNSKTVFQNIEYPLKLAKVDKQQRKDRVMELLDFVGLTQKANAYPAQLSGGQKQRVGIARALSTNPKILLADEATSALDPETTLEVLKLLRSANQKFGVTIVMITHTMNVVRLLCQKVAVMDNGKVVEADDIDKVFFNPKHQTTKNFIRTVHAMESGDLDAI